MGREEREEMCLFKDKWPKEKLTEEYIEATKDIKDLDKINSFIRPFKRKEDKGDHWQSPSETYKRKTYDCEDMAIMIMDILTRVMGRRMVWFIIFAGYYMKEGKKTYSAHAVILFESETRLTNYEYSNKKLIYLKQGISIIEQGYLHYPEGLKYIEIRNSEGKITEKKRKWIGYL